MMQDEAILRSFLHHGPRLVEDLSTDFLARALTGRRPAAGLREQLALALDRLAAADCRLTLAEQVEVATFFLPLGREQLIAAEPRVAPVLQLSARPADDGAGPVRVSASVQPGDAVLSSLRVLRNGQPLVSGAALSQTLLDALPRPARLVYRAEARYANFPDQVVEVALAQPLRARFGTGPAGVGAGTAALVAALPAVALAGQPLSLTFATTSGPANMLLWLPPGQQLTAIVNRNFGPANLLASFTSAPLALPGEGTGTLYWSWQRISSSNYPLDFTVSA